MLKKVIAHSLIFSLVFNNLAFATQSIIELDFKDSQTPQRLHVIPRMSNVGDVSHLEIDTEQKQAVVYLREKQEEALDEVEKNSSQGGDVPVTTKPVILQKHDIVNLPWELEPEKLTLFILNHTAWLSPLDEDGYKLAFKGGLLGGGNTGSTGGGGGGTYPHTITVTPGGVDCGGRNDWPKGTIGSKFCNNNGNDWGDYGINIINKPYVPPVNELQNQGGFPRQSLQPFGESPHSSVGFSHGYTPSYSTVNFPKGWENQASQVEYAIENCKWNQVYAFADDIGFPRAIIKDYLKNRKSDKEKLLPYLKAKKKRDLEEAEKTKRAQIRQEQDRSKIQNMKLPDEYDRHYIEAYLLPVLQQLNSHPAYKSYDAFISNKGTGYRVGMNLNDYWQQSWLDSKKNGEAARKLSLPRYLRPSHVMTQTDYDRLYLEIAILPTIRKFNSHPAYKDYKSFVESTGTGYKVGMNPEDYWQSWLDSKNWGEAAKKHPLTSKYQLPPHSIRDTETYDRQFIETTLLPVIRKYTSHPAYQDYRSFINSTGTGYKKGDTIQDYMNLQSWKTWKGGGIVKDFPKYEVPTTCNPFYGDYEKVKRLQHFINTTTWEGVYNYAELEGFSKEDVEYVDSRKKENITFDGYMKEVFDDQVLEHLGAYDFSIIPVGKMQKIDPMSPYDFFDLEGKMGGSGIMAGGAGGGKLGWKRLFTNQKKLSEQQIKTANNVIQKIQHRTRLQLQEKGILDAKGNLTKQAIKNSVEVKIKEPLKNPDVIKELTKNGTKIEDWKKMETVESIILPNGNKAKVHFYKNTKTGEVNTNIDFKLKGNVPLDNGFQEL